MDFITKSLEWEHGSPLHIETGRLARQADGAVVLSIGDTKLMATVVAKKEIDPKIDFLPLTVDYKEHYSACGKFPGGFFKRDGRLNEFEILTSRIVDRSIRPLFPEDYHADIQLIISLLSSDREVQPDALACFAASCAIMVSDLPFPEPVSTVRVTYKKGQYAINPLFSEMVGAELDLIVAGTPDSIVMVEGEMDEVTEEIMLEALKRAHAAIKVLNQFQVELRASVNPTTREYTKPEKEEGLEEKVRAEVTDQVMAAIRQVLPKQERLAAFSSIKESLSERILAEFPDDKKESIKKQVANNFELVLYDCMRRMILEDNRRLDGRKPEEIRPIWCEVGYLPRAHGSALFTRGETQSLTTVTLGSKLDEQTIDYATVEGSKKFMLQYNFPPYSTGEVKPLRAPARREIGHGNLAERALKKMIPEDNDHTIRVVSEILESNGSSSMATVCAGTLALMDAGVPIRRPVSGIAMGLIVENGKYAVLSDILGDEDHLGDMDFKTTGTEKGLTACQMDIKVRGLSFEILAKALHQAKEGRAHILSKMLETISEPRSDISSFAPRIIKFTIPVDTIGAIIGPGGKIIQEIQRQTGTTITIEEIDNAGIVSIASPNKEALQKAENWVKGIAMPPEVGTIYHGKVKNVREAGAFIEFLPGKDGWLHISEVSTERIPSMESVMSVGDELEVMYVGIDPRTNKYRLSIKAMNPDAAGNDGNRESQGTNHGYGNQNRGGDYNRGGDRDNRNRDRGGFRDNNRNPKNRN